MDGVSVAVARGVMPRGGGYLQLGVVHAGVAFSLFDASERATKQSAIFFLRHS